MTISLEKTSSPPPTDLQVNLQPGANLETDLEAPVPVDQIPEPKRTAFDRITAHREGAKQPLLADWLKQADERTAVFRWAAGYARHIVLFHLLRLPLYQWRLLVCAPRGVARTIGGIYAGLTDAEARPLRKSAVARDDVKEYMTLARERNARIRHRAVGAVVLAVPVLAILFAILFLLNGPLFYLAVLAVVDVFGVVGRNREKPLVSKATTPLHLAPVLRQEAVEIALRAIPGLIKGKDAKIEFPDPIVKDGPGYLARVNLPHGVTPADVMSKRLALASGLRRPVGCVWPSPGPQHGGQLDLWVGDQDIATARQPGYPLLERGTTSAFSPLPYGTNQRGRKVGVTLIENNVLVGAMVGQGKTSGMRVLGLGLALDVTVELHVGELKGSGDLACLEPVAHFYRSGQDDETIRLVVEDLKQVREDIERRAAVIKRIAKETPALCPNNKVTRELANRRDLGLHPVAVLLDEVQNLYSHEVHGKEAAKLVLDIIRLGRAFGVILIQATQRPDADSLPKAISSNAGIRIGLRIMDENANNMILGAGMYAAGIRATDFTTKDKGVAWLVGVEDEPIVVKSYNITTGMAEKIGQRARDLREQHDRLTGAAAGLVLSEREQRAAGHDLLADVRSIMGNRGVGWIWTAHLAEELPKLDENAYGDITAEVVGKMLAARGCPPKQINRTGPDGVRHNWQGVELADIATVMGPTA